jgi:hypothetical protein
MQKFSTWEIETKMWKKSIIPLLISEFQPYSTFSFVTSLLIVIPKLYIGYKSIYSVDHDFTSDLSSIAIVLSSDRIMICQVLQSFCLILGYFVKLLFEDKIDLSSLLFNAPIIIDWYLIPLFRDIYMIPCLDGPVGVHPDTLGIASQNLENPFKLLSLGWDYFNRREITEAEKITAKFCESSEKFIGIFQVLANCLFFSWILYKLREAYNLSDKFFNDACSFISCFFCLYFILRLIGQ